MKTGIFVVLLKVITNYVQITKPFTNCLEKGSKIGINDLTFIRTFGDCKASLTNDPILQYPDFMEYFNLTTDASNVAIGAGLSQRPIGHDEPIAYASWTLNDERKIIRP
ncbi:hypothetical protein JTB14_010638 [Gonioctena quinquepunctata]|nr:hypothetical protein JTB14_010638 [Gonioctena quinquepunctata]